MKKFGLFLWFAVLIAVFVIIILFFPIETDLVGAKGLLEYSALNESGAFG